MNYELINKVTYTPLTQIFINRGFTEKEMENYLNVSKEDLIDPLKLANMREGATMLVRHLLNQDRIFIQVDPDADGFTSSALLINYLERIAPSSKNLITYRFHEGKEHGLILETIPEDVKLVIAPDSASNNLEVHQALKEKGIDVLVLDHHECDKVSTYACVINNQTCDYPNKTLSGVGIVYKFCCYIDNLLNQLSGIEGNEIDSLIDLAALGIISDMMDLTENETHYIVQTGLRNISNPFFLEMVNRNNYQLTMEGTEYSPFGISFYVTPYINAMVRSGTQEQKELLFKAMLESEAYRLVPSTKRGEKGKEEMIVTQAVRTCANVKKHQDDAKKENLSAVEKIIEENNLLDNKILIVKLTEYIDKNLVGLIANQLMGKYGKPTIVLNRYENEEGIYWSGSARNVANSKLEDFRLFVEQSPYSEFAEGHASAFGTMFYDYAIDGFIKYCNETLKDLDFSPIYKVDFIYDGGDPSLEADILNIQSYYSLWGQGFTEPRIAIENVKITNKNITLMAKDRNPTLKITLPSGVELIKFGFSEDEFNKLVPEDNKAIYITVIGKCGRNEFNGKVSGQVKLEDYEINEIQYDF